MTGREILEAPLPRRQRPTVCMRITQTKVARVHPFMDGGGLPRMYRPTHDMVHRLFRADRGKADANVEQMHVGHVSVVICVVDPAMPGEPRRTQGISGGKRYMPSYRRCYVLRRTMTLAWRNCLS